MGDTTNIGWCHFTLNPWIGCHKVSPACKNCYAAVETFPRVQRGRGLELWGADAERHVTSDANWRKPLAWNRDAKAAGERRRVFCASMADVLEKREGEVGRKINDARARLWDLIEETDGLDWLLLSKRPENAPELFPERWLDALPRNVWMGATVENQECADQRIPHLLRIPAAVRFLSCEPLLGPIDLRPYLSRLDCLCCPRCGYRTNLEHATHCPNDGARLGADSAVDWVIVGFESGPGRRPRELRWMQSIAEQCADAGVPLYVKQDAAHKSGQQGEIPDALWAVKQFPHPEPRP